MNDPQVVDNATLSLHNLDVEKAASLSDLLGLAPVNNDVEKLSSVKTLQCGEFKYPDVSSPLCKILAPTKDRGHGPLFDLRYHSYITKKSAVLVFYDLSVTSTKIKYIKLKTKTQIFF